jgi:hypothetical protein
VIVTFRPEFTPPWLGRPHVTLFSLNRLLQGLAAFTARCHALTIALAGVARSSAAPTDWNCNRSRDHRADARRRVLRWCLSICTFNAGHVCRVSRPKGAYHM